MTQKDRIVITSIYVCGDCLREQRAFGPMEEVDANKLKQEFDADSRPQIVVLDTIVVQCGELVGNNVPITVQQWVERLRRENPNRKYRV